MISIIRFLLWLYINSLHKTFSSHLCYIHNISVPFRMPVCLPKFNESNFGQCWSKFRAGTKKIIDHKVFEGIVLLLILLSSLSLVSWYLDNLLWFKLIKSPSELNDMLLDTVKHNTHIWVKPNSFRCFLYAWCFKKSTVTSKNIQ